MVLDSWQITLLLRRVSGFLLIVLLGLLLNTPDALARHRHTIIRHVAPGGLVDHSASYADIVIDAGSGEILHATDIDALRHPASLSKMMTLYIVFQALESGRLTLNTYLPISVNAAEQAPSKLGLRPGQRIRVEDAILGLVTLSANDAAMVLAEGLGGSSEGFGQLMTKQAHALGMSRSHFNNPSGLPDPEQITTARDMAVLGYALIHHYPQFYPYFSHDSFTYAGIAHHNHNHLMDRYEGMDGIKTGYIRASGFNLVASARHGTLRLIGVVFGGHSTMARDNRMAQLLDQSFARAQAERSGGKPAGIVAAAVMGAANGQPAPDGGQDSETAQGDGNDDGGDVDGTIALPPKVSAIFPRGAAPAKPDYIPAAMPVVADAATVPQPATLVNVQPVPAVPATPPPVLPIAAAPPTPNAAPPPAPAAQPAQVASIAPPPSAVPVPAHDWGIQIGAYSDPAIARQALAALAASQPKLLSSADPQVQKTTTAAAPMYRARLMALDQHTAQSICGWLIKNGRNCLTVGP